MSKHTLVPASSVSVLRNSVSFIPRQSASLRISKPSIDDVIEQLSGVNLSVPWRYSLKYDLAYQKMLTSGLDFETRVQVIGQGLLAAFRKTRIQYSRMPRVVMPDEEKIQQEALLEKIPEEAPLSEWIERLDKYYDENAQAEKQSIVIAEGIQVWRKAQEIKLEIKQTINPQIKEPFSDGPIAVETEKWEKRLAELPLKLGQKLRVSFNPKAEIVPETKAEAETEADTVAETGVEPPPSPRPRISSLQVLSITTESSRKPQENPTKNSGWRCSCMVL